MNAMSPITDDEAIVADLRKRGIIGPISADFIASLRQDREFVELAEKIKAIPGASDKFKRTLTWLGIFPPDDTDDGTHIAARDRLKAAEENDIFDVALAEYQRVRAIELAWPRYKTIEEEKAHEHEWAAALTATTDAFDAMITIPVTDSPRSSAKLRAIADLYDLEGCGLRRPVLDQVLGELDASIAAPASTPEIEALIARHEEAHQAYNKSPDEDGPLYDAYEATLCALDAYEPRTLHEFARLFATRYSNGLSPHDDDVTKLVEIANRLTGARQTV